MAMRMVMRSVCLSAELMAMRKVMQLGWSMVMSSVCLLVELMVSQTDLQMAHTKQHV